MPHFQTTTYLHRATNQRVAPEPWRWQAVYTDGSELQQFDDASGEFHQFREIEQSRLHVFKMTETDGERVFTLLFPTGAKLIHFYKRYVLRQGQPDEQRFTLYVFGYEQRHGGQTFKQLHVITPTGELVVTDDLTRFSLE